MCVCVGGVGSSETCRDQKGHIRRCLWKQSSWASMPSSPHSTGHKGPRGHTEEGRGGGGLLTERKYIVFTAPLVSVMEPALHSWLAGGEAFSVETQVVPPRGHQRFSQINKRKRRRRRRRRRRRWCCIIFFSSHLVPGGRPAGPL